MNISNELLSKIISGDSSSKVIVLEWHIEKNIIESGNNHTSELSRLVVEYQRKGKIFKKSFLLKIPSAHPAYKIGLTYGVYDREYPIYTSVLEEMYKIDGEHIAPRLYYAGEKHSLMLKDLSMSGYKMVDRLQQLDYQPCCFVFQSIAKFHALSVKLNQSMPQLSTKYRHFPWMKNPDTVDKTNEFSKNSLDYFEKLFNLKSPKLTELLATWKKTGVVRFWLDQMDHDKFKFNVLNHSDLWTGNTLFKFDKYGIVKKVKLIDFQRCHWMNPVCDIWFFTITSMRFDVFEKHFDDLLEIYVEALNKILRHLNCSPYSLQDLIYDLDGFQSMAVYIAIAWLPQFISTHEDPFDFTNVVVNGDQLDIDRCNEIYQNKIYASLMKKWITYFQKKRLSRLNFT